MKAITEMINIKRDKIIPKDAQNGYWNSKKEIKIKTIPIIRRDCISPHPLIHMTIFKQN